MSNYHHLTPKARHSNHRYRYYCITTGEVLCNLPQVIRATIVDLFRYRVLHIWQYNKEGF